jgi:pyrroline-5-carboxylate reductase
MNKIGFIGFGNMGGTMLKALLKTGSIPEDQVIVFTRTKEKLKNFI